MDTYFYCSYEHSRTGFFHTRLEGDVLVPVDGGHNGLPEGLGEFFSYDQFLVLWREFSKPLDKPWHPPQPTSVLFGLRELKGSMADGRTGTVNMAIYAHAEENQLLSRIALAILGDFDSFRTRLFGWLSVGGPCSYQLDGAAYYEWLQRCKKSSRLKLLASGNDPAVAMLPHMHRRQPPRFERDLLHLAVCTGSWKETSKTMGDRINWYIKPRCVLTEEAFLKTFTGRAPVWELEPDG